MTEELVHLRLSILESNFEEALAIVDQLEAMSRQAILRNIQSFLDRMMMHLIKNQVEQKLTNYCAASILASVIGIKRLNLKANKTFYYIQRDEWDAILEESLKLAITYASVDTMNGQLSPFQLSELVDKTQINLAAEKLIDLTYVYSTRDLAEIVPNFLAQLPGGEDWKQGKR
ncbi:hypothetical protein [Microseira sp. BLCC-F43]|jgi:hypothetical protein|uniref:hypothetical protein n=1 Tax=Microseira sp. BLCC-F43 TaxID=3153602 RepID=UPI0035BA2C8C